MQRHTGSRARGRVPAVGVEADDAVEVARGRRCASSAQVRTRGCRATSRPARGSGSVVKPSTGGAQRSANSPGGTISGRKTTTASGSKLAQLARAARPVLAPPRKSMKRGSMPPAGACGAHTSKYVRWPTNATRTGRRPAVGDRAGCGTGRRPGARTIARSCASPSFCRTSSSPAASASSSSTPASSTATTASTRGSCSRATARTVPHWPYRGLRDVPVLALDEARAERFDVAVATWWETASVALPPRRATATSTSCSCSRTAPTRPTSPSGSPPR